ncbi:MAG: PKD domain-containing protein [Halobacteriales archaeon]|nr:PKD domain-containing protein [Halobacteriales archaeon]
MRAALPLLFLLVAGCVGPGASTSTNLHAPVANFHIDKLALTPGQVLHADAGAAKASDGGTIAVYAWDWGDGMHEEGGQLVTREHSYTYPGRYTVRLTVQDAHDPPLVDTKSWAVGVDDLHPIDGTVQGGSADAEPQEVRVPFAVGQGAQAVQLRLSVEDTGAGARVAAMLRNPQNRIVLSDVRDLLGNRTSLEMTLPRAQLAPSGAWTLVVLAQQGAAKVTGNLAVRYSLVP